MKRKVKELARRVTDSYGDHVALTDLFEEIEGHVDVIFPVLSEHEGTRGLPRHHSILLRNMALRFLGAFRYGSYYDSYHSAKDLGGALEFWEKNYGE